MRHLGNLVVSIIMAVNLLFIILMLVTAFSPYIDPRQHAMESCLGLLFPIFLLINTCFLVFWLLVKIKLVIPVVLAFLICYPQIKAILPYHNRTKDLPDSSFSVLSYNVMMFDRLQKATGGNPILGYIKEKNADIVCLQEYGVSAKSTHLTQKDIDRELSMYPFKHIYPIGNQTIHLACYSKFPIISARLLPIKSKYNAAILYEMIIGGDTTTVINCHLESNKLTKEDKVVYEDMLKAPETDKVKRGVKQLVKKLAEASAIRSSQADIIAQEIESSPYEHIIICGDFNDTAISYTHRVVGENLEDAFTESGKGLGISYNQNKFFFRIDHILASDNLKPYNCVVDRSINNSDHYPIWCTYVKKQN